MADSVFQRRVHHPLVVMDDFKFEDLPDDDIDIPSNLLIHEDEDYVANKHEEWNDLGLQDLVISSSKKQTTVKKNTE